MALDKYTNTYTDVDFNIMDAPDLVGEFNRVAFFLNQWAESINSLGTAVVYENVIAGVADPILNISPANGIIQNVLVSADLGGGTIALNFTERNEGDPLRIYVVLRFLDPSTHFQVSGPSGQTHSFGVNKSLHSPSQVDGSEGDSGLYTAVVIATYGSVHGALINVFADNAEIVDVANDDILNLVAQ